MRLIELFCNKASFRPIRFNPSGLTIIKGARAEGGEGSVNGVGKTLTAKLVNYCLASSGVIPALNKSIPEWVFCLRFSLNGVEHQIERRADNKYLALDGEEKKYKELTSWFNENGPFYLPREMPYITFRSLITRFLRSHKKDCSLPIETRDEESYQALLRNLYLLGADYNAAYEKVSLKEGYDKKHDERKAIESSDALKKVLRSGLNSRIRLRSITKELEELEASISSFVVAKDYRAIEKQADIITERLRELEKEISVLNFRVSGINKSMEEKPDITNEQLHQMYAGLQSVFKEEALQHFQAVEDFHRTLAQKRKEYLAKDKLVLLQERKKKDQELNGLAAKRDALLQKLQGKKALDEYKTLVERLSSLKEEKERLEEYISFDETISADMQAIKAQIAQNDEAAFKYVQSQPLASYDEVYRNLASLLYPNQEAGIQLTNNTDFNKMKFNLLVELQGQESDGITEARIIIYDWLLLTKGVQHYMNFVWHDSRLFANIDELARAKWFSYILHESKAQDKQYIVSLNIENYDTTIASLSEEDQQLFKNAVQIELTKDAKLLGQDFADTNI